MLPNALENSFNKRQLNADGEDGAEGAGDELADSPKDAKKMSEDQIGEFLGAGENWHKTTAKKSFVKEFSQQLKGDTNADFYLDKKTKQVFLRSNKSNIWVNTGLKFD